MKAHAALARWGRLWGALGGGNLTVGVDGDGKQYLRTSNGCVVFGEAVHRKVAISIEPTKHYVLAKYISYEEADVLQSLLLGV